MALLPVPFRCMSRGDTAFFENTLSVFPFIYFGQQTEMLIKRTSLQQLDVLRFRSAFTWSFSAGWFQVY
jgi:hypothetical protein